MIPNKNRLVRGHFCLKRSSHKGLMPLMTTRTVPSADIEPPRNPLKILCFLASHQTVFAKSNQSMGIITRGSPLLQA